MMNGNAPIVFAPIDRPAPIDGPCPRRSPSFGPLERGPFGLVGPA